MNQTLIPGWAFNSIARAAKIGGHALLDAPSQNSAFNIRAFQPIGPHFFLSVGGKVIALVEYQLADTLESTHFVSNSGNQRSGWSYIE